MCAMCCGSQLELDNVLDDIHFVESRCGENVKHKDGVSVGEYGLTLDCLLDVNEYFGTDYKDMDRRDPVKAREIAGLYLRLMLRRFNCADFLEAAGRYHSPGNADLRKIYIKRLLRKGAKSQRKS